MLMVCFSCCFSDNVNMVIKEAMKIPLDSKLLSTLVDVEEIRRTKNINFRF